MSKFVLDDFNNVVNGKIDFYKLIEDGDCYFNNFCKTIQREGVWTEQLDGLVSLMNRVSRLEKLPKEKYHPYSTGIKGVEGFEFKTKDLRAYGIKDTEGHLIIVAGKKSTQGEDESQFKSIVKRYKGL